MPWPSRRPAPARRRGVWRRAGRRTRRRRARGWQATATLLTQRRPGDRPVSTPAAYWVAVAVGTVVCATVCAACRRRPGPWVVWAGRAISLVLALDAVVVRRRPPRRGQLVGARLAAAGAVQPGAARRRGRLLGAELVPGRRAHLLLGARRRAAGGGHPGSGRRVPPARVLRVRRRPPRGRHRGPVPRGRPPAAATARRGDARVRRDGGLHGVRRLVRLAHRLQLHVPGSDPGDGLAVVGPRPWPWYILSAAGVALVLFWVLDAPFRHRRPLGAHLAGSDQPRRIRGS